MFKGSIMPKPQFIGRVIEAITKLSEKHGSSAKNILNFVLKNSKTINRNLTLQIQQALKQALHDGLIELMGSRYKLRRSSTPVKKPKQRPAPPPPSAPENKNPEKLPPEEPPQPPFPVIPAPGTPGASAEAQVTDDQGPIATVLRRSSRRPKPTRSKGSPVDGLRDRGSRREKPPTTSSRRRTGKVSSGGKPSGRSQGRGKRNKKNPSVKK